MVRIVYVRSGFVRCIGSGVGVRLGLGLGAQVALRGRKDIAAAESSAVQLLVFYSILMMI